MRGLLNYRRYFSRITIDDLLIIFSASLLLYMPLHTLLSRWLSLYTGGLMVWETGKDFLTVLIAGLAALVLSRKLIKRKLPNSILYFLICSLIYTLLHLGFWLKSGVDLHATITGTLYNLRPLAYLVIGLAVGLSINKKRLLIISKILLFISTITVVFALIQYLAPKDLMTHFGYSIERGAKPNFFIDDKPDFPRVMSTLREPNSFGAYLIVPITLLWVRIMGDKFDRKKVFILGLFGVHLLALILTFSRSAWVGALISLALASVIFKKEFIGEILKKYWKVLLLLAAMFAIGLFLAKDHYVVQNILLHSDQKTVEVDPNQKRLDVQKQAVKDILANPLGHGPGTAGPVAFANRAGGLITENYYLQIGYEVGILGLLLFLLLMFISFFSIGRSPPAILGIVLLSSFWAYAFIGMLTHVWTNEAVAYQWWLLSGIVIANFGRITDSKKA